MEESLIQNNSINDIIFAEPLYIFILKINLNLYQKYIQYYGFNYY